MVRFDDRYLDMVNGLNNSLRQGGIESGLVALGCMLNNKPVIMPAFFDKKSKNDSESRRIRSDLQGSSGKDGAVNGIPFGAAESARHGDGDKKAR